MGTAVPYSQKSDEKMGASMVTTGGRHPLDPLHVSLIVQGVHVLICRFLPARQAAYR